MKDFTNKVAAITGAASGMGRELAVALAKDGCHLAICDVNGLIPACGGCLLCTGASHALLAGPTCSSAAATDSSSTRSSADAGHSSHSSA